MLSKTVTNNTSDQQHHHHYQSVIGDLLLHFETKTIIVQVITHSSSATSSLTPDGSSIRRFSPNSFGPNGSRTIIPCDLKNTVLLNVPSDQVRTSKKLLRMQKAGAALVKELKSKVKRSDSTVSKTYVVQTNGDDDRTHF